MQDIPLHEVELSREMMLPCKRKSGFWDREHRTLAFHSFSHNSFKGQLRIRYYISTTQHDDMRHKGVFLLLFTFLGRESDVKMSQNVRWDLFMTECVLFVLVSSVTKNWTELDCSTFGKANSGDFSIWRQARERWSVNSIKFLHSHTYTISRCMRDHFLSSTILVSFGDNLRIVGKQLFSKTHMNNRKMSSLSPWQTPFLNILIGVADQKWSIKVRWRCEDITHITHRNDSISFLMKPGTFLWENWLLFAWFHSRN